MPLSTPVALFIFNRPEITRRTFEAIARAQPARLLIVADGPRDNREAVLCETARRVALGTDWPCITTTALSDQHLGCRLRMASGLEWVFSECERAILLEDDCVASPHFFSFCEALLEKYVDDERVSMIGGGGFHGEADITGSYFFSRYTPIWGWATWRRAWRGYDVNMTAWPSARDSGLLESLFDDPDECDHWRRRFDKAHAGHSTWDHQWTLHCWRRGRLAIVPRCNLVTNIGFGSDATHTKSASEASRLCVPWMDINFPLHHPPGVSRNLAMDRRFFTEVLNPTPAHKR